LTLINRGVKSPRPTSTKPSRHRRSMPILTIPTIRRPKPDVWCRAIAGRKARRNSRTCA
jgi:hypothetical protein